MADTVRYMLEDMIPELEDMQKKKYFTKAELRQIVKKRQDFEYLIKRRAPLKQDFLRYIEYETKLEKLLQHRREKQNTAGKRTLADYAIVRRIHFIFERATRKFKSDLALWTRWLDFCKSTHSNKSISKVVAKALAIHPTSCGLWTYAAAWEFEHNGNAAAARALMQQGLRMCKDDPDLWVEYLRMELLYVQKLRLRRQVLGLDNGDSAGTASGNAVAQPPPSPQHSDSDSNDSTPPLTLQQAQQPPEATPGAHANDNDDGSGPTGTSASAAVLSGAVVHVVYRNAIARLPGSLVLRRRCLEVLRDFDFPGVEGLRAAVYDSIECDFPTDEAAWDLRARRHIDANSLADSTPSCLQRCEAVYQSALAAVPTPSMHLLYASYLRERLAALQQQQQQQAGEDNGAVAAAARAAQQLLKVYQAAHQAGQDSEELYLQWMAAAEELQLPKIALKAARRACERLPRSAAVWEARIALELRLRSGAGGSGSSSTGAPPVQVHEAIKQALSLVAADKAPGIWLQALSALGSSADDMRQLCDLLVSSLTAGPKGPVTGGMGAVAAAYLRALHQMQGQEAAGAFYRRMSHVPSPGGDLHRAAIELEKQQLVASQACTSADAAAADSSKPRQTSTHAQVARVRALYEDAIAAYGSVDAHLWISFALFEQQYEKKAVGTICWRATKALDNPDAFIASCREALLDSLV